MSAQPQASSVSSRKFGPIAGWLGVVVLVAAGLLGSDAWSLRDELLGNAIPKAAPVATSRGTFTPVHAGPAMRSSLRSTPWWQSLPAVTGTGLGAPAPIKLASGTLQWRVKATCSSGHILVREGAAAAPLVDAPCPAGGTGYGTESGRVRLQVVATGPWQLKVEQQIDVPLDEAPLPMMSNAPVAAQGRLYNVDQVGTGTATFYRPPSGPAVLRLSKFFVTPTSDLELWLSPARHPESSKRAIPVGARRIGRLDVTAGSLNFTLPAGLDPAAFRSLVVWCAATASAYAAVDLMPGR